MGDDLMNPIYCVLLGIAIGLTTHIIVVYLTIIVPLQKSVKKLMNDDVVQFEYLTWYTIIITNEELRKLGLIGWELCYKDDSGCIFKRPLQKIGEN
ncbi:hypothetical protein KAT92_06450 [Candidatus Babeliales bacterium]|nr:hypothetical protein [Candidatus Babeliales bacterium]